MALKFDGDGIIGRDTHDNLRLNGDGTVTFEQLANGSLIRLNNLADVPDKAAARANLGLGSGATVNSGTGPNQLIALDANGKMPAVDGSQLTNLPDQNGGIPDYQTFSDFPANTWIQAPYDCFVSGECGGPYTNDFRAYAGTTTGTAQECGRYGDDINNNTKFSTLSFFVRAGNFFQVQSEGQYLSRYYKV
jgi:hypothetical protein